MLQQLGLNQQTLIYWIYQMTMVDAWEFPKLRDRLKSHKLWKSIEYKLFDIVYVEIYIFNGEKD